MKEIREKCGITQQELADKLGVTQATISFWETGERYPSPSNLLQLEKLLGVPAGDIIRAINEAAENRKEERST